MAAGLQAWDASGRLVVDLTDFTTRFVTSVTVTIPANQTAAFLTIGGVTPDAHFAVITKGNDSLTQGLLLTELCASCTNGGVWVVSLNGIYVSNRTVVVDVYTFK